ncbi:hypothetical protein BKA83DRAFT_4358786 [Pisolithus microcarpus]|nr:hypothetical protein BKA83DRAFT_4358786 [Pisolithus microcarpus]
MTLDQGEAITVGPNPITCGCACSGVVHPSNHTRAPGCCHSPLLFLARSVVVDSRVFLIAEKIFLSRGHQQYQVLPLHVEGLRDRMREEETYFVEIDTKLAKQPAPFVGFTRLLRHVIRVYITPFEPFLDAIGVVGAMATGVAQVRHICLIPASLMNSASPGFRKVDSRLR